MNPPPTQNTPPASLSRTDSHADGRAASEAVPATSEAQNGAESRDPDVCPHFPDCGDESPDLCSAAFYRRHDPWQWGVSHDGLRGTEPVIEYADEASARSAVSGSPGSSYLVRRGRLGGEWTAALR